MHRMYSTLHTAYAQTAHKPLFILPHMKHCTLRQPPQVATTPHQPHQDPKVCLCRSCMVIETTYFILVWAQVFSVYQPYLPFVSLGTINSYECYALDLHHSWIQLPFICWKYPPRPAFENCCCDRHASRCLQSNMLFPPVMTWLIVLTWIDSLLATARKQLTSHKKYQGFKRWSLESVELVKWGMRCVKSDEL